MPIVEVGLRIMASAPTEEVELSHDGDLKALCCLLLRAPGRYDGFEF
jgi:hypothetical protein